MPKTGILEFFIELIIKRIERPWYRNSGILNDHLIFEYNRRIDKSAISGNFGKFGGKKIGKSSFYYTIFINIFILFAILKINYFHFFFSPNSINQLLWITYLRLFSLNYPIHWFLFQYYYPKWYYFIFPFIRSRNIAEYYPFYRNNLFLLHNNSEIIFSSSPTFSSYCVSYSPIFSSIFGHIHISIKLLPYLIIVNNHF